MKPMKIALCALFAAGTAAALVPSSAQAQYPGGYGQERPGANPALLEARKQIQEAEKTVVQIRQDMQKIKARITSRFEGKEEWEESAKTVKAAEAAHEAAKKKAMAKLIASPDYKAAKEAQAKADQQVQTLTAQGPKADTKALAAAQQSRIESALTVRKLEADAMENDAQVLATRTKVTEAKKSREAMEEEVEQALQQDPDYQAAQQELQAAQEQVAQMKAGLQQQVAADREARRQQQQSLRGQRSGGRGGAYGQPR